jgi:hypothetical protein
MTLHFGWLLLCKNCRHRVREIVADIMTGSLFAVWQEARAFIVIRPPALHAYEK